MAAASTAREAHEPVTVIEPGRSLAFPNLREVWEYRDLLAMLVRRDLAIRYKQTAVGALWAILQPVALATVFSVFLGALADVPSRGGVPYAIYAYSGMLMWLMFSKALQACADSTVASAELLSKVWFPRLIVPISAVLSPLVDFAVGFVVLLVALPIAGESIGPGVLLVPFAALLCTAVALAGGLWFAAFHVRYRDVQHLVPFLLLVGLFVTPIIYPFSLVPDAARVFYALNPMVGVLELFRWMLFGDLAAPGYALIVPVVVSVVALVGGALYFRSAEQTFADVI
jgi:lipopolysaccharide transport system permease protein